MGNFDKFTKKELTGAAKKEALKQQKRKVKKEREDYFKEKRKQQFEERAAQQPGQHRGSKSRNEQSAAGAGRSAASSDNKGRKPYGRKENTDRSEVDKSGPGKAEGMATRKFASKQSEKRPYAKKENTDRSDVNKSGTGRAEGMATRKFASKPSEKRPYARKENTDRSGAERSGPRRAEGKEADKYGSKSPTRNPARDDSQKSWKDRAGSGKNNGPSPRRAGGENEQRNAARPGGAKRSFAERTSSKPAPRPEFTAKKETDEPMPLNKAIAYGGISSRREAAEIIKGGKVKVNGQLILEPGYKVNPEDEVTAFGKKVLRKVSLVYILLNKPKDFLTTVSDDKGRKTVMDIVRNASDERIYPVGRLDRNTTGVLLLTNDGDLAQQLSHPKFEIRKVYEARLDKPVIKAHLDALVSGFELEDGFIAADVAAWPDSADHSIVGIEIHSGKNRIVRRMFEHLGYDVKNLDRVLFANLTKKNVERGKWRFLKEKEVRLLKYFNKSKDKK